MDDRNLINEIKKLVSQKDMIPGFFNGTTFNSSNGTSYTNLVLTSYDPGKAFIVKYQDSWLCVVSSSNELIRTNIIVDRRNRWIEPVIKDTFNVQILYFVWDAGYFNWYVGGDRKVPLLIKREPDEITFPSTAPNSDRGVDYTEYELSNISNLDKGNFRAIINTNYQEQYGVNPIIELGVFRLVSFGYDNNLGTYRYEWVKDDPNRPVVFNQFNRGTYYRKQHLVNSKGVSNEYDLVHQKGYSTVKGFRYLGNGYSFGSINLLRRYYARNFSVQGFYFDKYIEIPPLYACYLSYLEFVESKEPNTPASKEVVVDVSFGKDHYEYSLPCSLESGAMPTSNPITKYNGSLVSYTYEGEHYLMVGKDSYITEYIKKTSPTNILREIRFYQNKKFVTNLNTNTAFVVSHDVYNNGGYRADFSNSIQLQRYKKDDTLTFITNTGFIYTDFCQSLLDKKLTIASTHNQTGDFWMSECIVKAVSTNQAGAVIFILSLIKDPNKVDYSSLLCGIFGKYFHAKQGVLYLESGSYLDFAICASDISPTTDGSLFESGYLGAYNNTSEFHPFDPDVLDYLHKAILEKTINYDIYYQQNLFGDNLRGKQYPQDKTITPHLSDLLYLNNNFTRLDGNKIYRSQVIYKYPNGETDTIAEPIQHRSTDKKFIRNVEGIDHKATCYIEVWNIGSTGNVTRENKLLQCPVYGLYTEDINWTFSDILDIGIGFS